VTAAIDEATVSTTRPKLRSTIAGVDVGGRGSALAPRFLVRDLEAANLWDKASKLNHAKTAILALTNGCSLLKLMHILIDEAEVRSARQIASALVDAGHDPVMALDGESALERALQSSCAFSTLAVSL